MANKERLYLTAISIQSGIITLITDDGDIGYYRQRGIGQIPDNKKMMLISVGLLARNWMDYPELPRHFSISYEDPEIMGRARASYPNADALLQAVAGTKKKAVNTKNRSEHAMARSNAVEVAKESRKANMSRRGNKR